MNDCSRSKQEDGNIHEIVRRLLGSVAPSQFPEGNGSHLLLVCVDVRASKPTGQRAEQGCVLSGHMVIDERALVGIADASTQGAVTAEQIEMRPIARAGDVLETIPGVVISQHSGEGKANQYYLRGFNLDHGTDFATTVAGVQVNFPTHAHGHGYTDLNFVVPELAEGGKLQLTVTLSDDPAPAGGFAWNDTPDEQADLSYADRPVLRYMYHAFDDSSKEAREKTKKVFHHLFTPDGSRLITKGPGGKYSHHRGLFYGFNRMAN